MNWDRVKISDCVSKVSTVNPSSVYNENLFKYVDIASIDNKTKTIGEVQSITGISAPSRARQVLEEGDILVSTVRPNLNAVALVTNELNGAIGSTGFCVLRPINNTLHPRYLFYWVRSRSFISEMEKKATGASYPAVSDSIIKNSEIPLPPLPIQQQIADTLDKADALRRKDQELLDKYDELAQAVFYEMFGDPEKNEKNWEKVLFGSLIKSIRYGTGSPPKYSTEGIPFIRATNIKEGRIVDKGMVYLDEKEASKISKCYINEGDLIIVRSGVNTGDCGIIPKKHHGSLAGYDLIIEINKPLGAFYHFLINSKWGQKMIKPISRRAAQPHLNVEQVKTLVFILPDLNALEKFSEILNIIENKRNLVLATQNQIAILNNSLASSFFS